MSVSPSFACRESIGAESSSGLCEHGGDQLTDKLLQCSPPCPNAGTGTRVVACSILGPLA